MSNDHLDDIELAGRVVEMFGLKLYDLSLGEATGVLVDRVLEGREGQRVYTPNVTQVVQLSKDQKLKEIYHQADLLVADGMPLIWVSNFIDTPIRERVTGADLLPNICSKLTETGESVYLLGGKKGVADRAADNLKSELPGLKIAGHYSPPFGFLDDEAENQKIVKKIRKAEADVLFVGLGFPKQEIWIHRYADDCGVKLSMGVGAAFDFIAMTLNRAPEWMRANGLEWFYRLLQEPSRLWKRYLVIGPQFIPIAVSEIVKHRFGK